MKESALQIAHRSYAPKMPSALRGSVCLKEGERTESVADQAAIKELFPNTYGLPVIEIVTDDCCCERKREHCCCESEKEQCQCESGQAARNVGVILSGGQAPGGHNVISGLYDGLKRMNKDSKLYGFLGGPSGLIEGKYKELTGEIMASTSSVRAVPNWKRHGSSTKE